MQRGIERAVLHLEKVVGGALDVLADMVAVGGAVEESAEDEHVQGALEEVGSRLGFFSHGRHSTLNER